ncbi:MAG: carbon monoxide dehydrogenase subunit G [Burkholderiaceae bacterium]
MKLEGQKTIPASIERTWAALNDPEILRDSITGCESLEQTAEDEYAAAMKIRIGPVNARFKGKLKLSDIVPPRSYRIAFEGQGGAAGFGKGNADIRLEPAEDDATLLAYVAEAQVGGKIAQIGSRLVDAAAAKIAEDFFTAFEARLAAESTDATASGEPPAAPGGTDAKLAGDAGSSQPTQKAAAASQAAVANAAAAPGANGSQGSSKVLWWVVGAAVVAVLAYAILA